MSEYGKLTYRELEDYSNMQAAQIRKKNNKIEQLQARVKELETINLGLTKTLLEEESEKAKLVEALGCILSMDDEIQIVDVMDSKAREMVEIARDALAAYRKGG